MKVWVVTKYKGGYSCCEEGSTVVDSVFTAEEPARARERAIDHCEVERSEMWDYAEVVEIEVSE